MKIAPLLLFLQDRPDHAESFLRGRRAGGPTWLTAVEFLEEGHMFARGPNLAKPGIRPLPSDMTAEISAIVSRSARSSSDG